ncbi:sensor histidine kinase [Umezawaea endophytica]|uniref:histidine kinase n=1 Tax=Umezawaea endophytica TaxID=1654476 RepID=A0A9X3AFA7_9PSEU|nr:histidine kinase [Umezawaea endophytica]MCS7478006.1 histidine kinase [Umezawaea endophytica]
MRLLLRGRDAFVTRTALLGSGFGILNLVYAEDWGRVLALAMLPALVVRTVWRTMPGWLLLAWTVIPTLVGDIAVVTHTANMVLITAMAVVAASSERRVDTVAMALCLVSPFLVWALDTNDWHRGIGAWLWSAGLLLGWVLGRLVGEQQTLIAELERTRVELAEAAVVADRQRIARDLHDLVGHSFSVVLLHLAGARMNLLSAPDEAVDALRRAEVVGREGMDELRQALVLMHRGGHSPAASGLGHLDDLVTSYRDAGLRVDLTVADGVDQAAAGPRIVLHDVVREALTNVVKHATRPEACIRVALDDDGIAVHVTSPCGPNAGRGGAGMGLTGLEHRVTAIDGTFRARPSGDRWTVQALIPRTLAGARS